MKRVFIADSTLLRDEGTFSFKESIEIARQLENLKVDIIEMPKIRSERKDTLLVKTVSAFVKEAIISVECDAYKDDIDLAAAALCTAAKPRIRISIPLSDVGMEYGYHKKAPAMIKLIGELVLYAKEKISDVEFCAKDATRADKATLLGAVKAAYESGASTITLCESEGVMMPDEFAAFVNETVKDASIGNDAVIGVLCTDTNGMAAACSVMAAKDSCSLIKAAVNSGITSLSVACDIFKNCGNNCGFKTSISYTNAKRTISQIFRIANGEQGTRNVASAGDISEESVVTLDNNDTKEAVNAAASALGYDLSDEDIYKVYEEFLRVAEKKKVGARELDAIIASVALQVPPTYKLVSYIINSGNIIASSAQITLSRNSEELHTVMAGNGPIDAAFKAIEQIIGRHLELDDFQIQSVTEGKEAVGNAIVKLRSNGKLYSGKGVSTDIIGASIRAYLSAVNKIVYEEI